MVIREKRMKKTGQKSFLIRDDHIYSKNIDETFSSWKEAKENILFIPLSRNLLTWIHTRYNMENPLFV